MISLFLCHAAKVKDELLLFGLPQERPQERSSTQMKYFDCTRSSAEVASAGMRLYSLLELHLLPLIPSVLSWISLHFPHLGGSVVFPWLESKLLLQLSARMWLDFIYHCGCPSLLGWGKTHPNKRMWEEGRSHRTEVRWESRHGNGSGEQTTCVLRMCTQS